MPRRKFILVAALAMLVNASVVCAQPVPPPGTYEITNKGVDVGTFLGWRVFHSACFSCHGVDALGTDLAPNLVQRIKGMTQREFATKVLTSYRIVGADENSTSDDTYRDAMIDEVLRRDRGGRSAIAMPAWEGDARVRPHVLDLYAYLSARGDNVLPPGRPTLRPEQ